MKTTTAQQKNTASIERPSVVVVMGHIDHGKSTLLDYIRKTNVVDKEAGGITQHMSAYEVAHNGKRITFLDTPGHEAFQSLRERGSKVADIAILVVSAEDGVKPQTKEALKCILAENIPYIVAINKIDRPNADVERTKQSLAENEIYIEGYGGTVSSVPISAKTGEGVPDLLDLILLTAEVGEFEADPHGPVEGTVIESNLDQRKGISATLIIKNGTLTKGMFVAAPGSMAPVRAIENSNNERVDSATFSTPVRITGWDELVSAGSVFKAFNTKDEALEYKNSKKQEKDVATTERTQAGNDTASLPIVIKADSVGSLEAILYEVRKIKNERITPLIVSATIGAISENDVRLASTKPGSVILGFHTKADPQALAYAGRTGIEIQTFSIIYKLAEWIENALTTRAPKITVEEVTGVAKIVRVFSKVKDKQIIGGKVETGTLKTGETFKIMRRDAEIGTGKIRGLQQLKKETSTIEEGKEFGGHVESKIELAPGDRLTLVEMVEK